MSDNGACSVGRNGRKGKKGKEAPVPKGVWKPTAFEDKLLDRGIELINSRPHRPRTNGKIERFLWNREEEIQCYESVSKYVKFYNEERLHFSLDIHNHQTPLKAFHDKTVTDTIRKNNPKWMEEDMNN